MKSFPKRNQGFSLIEILLVIGIIAVLAIAAFLVFPQVQASSRANTEQSNIQTLAAGVKNLYQGRYETANNTRVNAARIVPASMNGGDTSTGTLTSSWGAPVTVTGTATNFTITYADMPDSVCLKLVPGLVNNFDTVTVGGSDNLGQSGDPDDRGADAIVAACNATPTALLTVISN